MEKDKLLNLTGLWAHDKQPDIYSAKMQQGTIWLRRNKGNDTPDMMDNKSPDWWLSWQSGVDKSVVNLAGLYANESKAGKDYLSGNFGGLRIMCFYMDKKSDKHPDISVTFGERKRNDGE